MADTTLRYIPCIVYKDKEKSEILFRGFIVSFNTYTYDSSYSSDYYSIDYEVIAIVVDKDGELSYHDIQKVKILV